MYNCVVQLMLCGVAFPFKRECECVLEFYFFFCLGVEKYRVNEKKKENHKDKTHLATQETTINL